MKNALSHKTNRAAELAAEKGASHRLTVIPVTDMNVTVNKREFRDISDVIGILITFLLCESAATLSRLIVP